MGLQISADLDVSDLGITVLKWVTKWLDGRRKRPRLAKEGKELLGISADRFVTYRHSSAHSHFSSRCNPHPDNGDALNAVAGDDYDAAKRENRIITVENLAVDIGQSAVLIGSPTAEDFSRIVFGYQVSEGENGLRFTDKLFDLPFRWHLDPTQIDASARRLVRGHGWIERPNWSIRGLSEWTPYVRNRDGVLEVDYLLVTRIKNFLTPESLDSGKFIVSVAGTHGTGTRAVELLLSDSAILTAVREELKKLGWPPWYQLVFEVSKFTHYEAEGTRAHAISLKDAVAIDNDLDMWRKARDEVGPRIIEWQLRHEGFEP